MSRFGLDLYTVQHDGPVARRKPQRLFEAKDDPIVSSDNNPQPQGNVDPDEFNTSASGRRPASYGNSQNNSQGISWAPLLIPIGIAFIKYGLPWLQQKLKESKGKPGKAKATK